MVATIVGIGYIVLVVKYGWTGVALCVAHVAIMALCAHRRKKP